MTPSTINLLGTPLEGELEVRRLGDRLARDAFLYLHTASCESSPHVYLVEPIGQLDRHHTSWLKKLFATSLGSHGELDSYALGYWSGEAHPDDQSAPWEYRAAGAKVLKRVGGSFPATQLSTSLAQARSANRTVSAPTFFRSGRSWSD